MKTAIKLLILALIFYSCASLESTPKYFGIVDSGVVNHYKEDGNYIVDYAVKVTDQVKSLKIYYYSRHKGDWVQHNYSTYLEKQGRNNVLGKRLLFDTDSLQTIRVTIIARNFNRGHEGSGLTIQKKDMIKLQQLFSSPLANE